MKLTKGQLLNSLYAVLIIIALAGIFWLKILSKRNVQKIIAQKNIDYVVQPKKDELTQILSAGGAAKCDFSQALPKGTVTGSVYIGDNQIRADISAPDKVGVSKISHTITKGNTMWLWYDKNTTGMKIVKKADAVAVQETTASALDLPIMSLKNIIGDIESYNAKCTEWEYDAFTFTPPPSIKFIDGVEFMDSLNKSLCSKCDLEDTEASRLLCRRELKCK